MEIESGWLAEFVFFAVSAVVGRLLGGFGIASLLFLQPLLQLVGRTLLPRHLFLALLERRSGICH